MRLTGRKERAASSRFGAQQDETRAIFGHVLNIVAQNRQVIDLGRTNRGESSGDVVSSVGDRTGGTGGVEDDDRLDVQSGQGGGALAQGDGVALGRPDV